MLRELVWDLQDWFDDVTSYDYKLFLREEWANQTRGMSPEDINLMIFSFIMLYILLLSWLVWHCPRSCLSVLVFTIAVVKALWKFACVCGKFVYLVTRYAYWPFRLLLAAFAWLLSIISRLLVKAYHGMLQYGTSLDLLGTQKLARALRDVDSLRQEYRQTLLLNTEMSEKFEKLKKEHEERPVRLTAASRCNRPHYKPMIPAAPGPRDHMRIPEPRARRFREKYYFNAETQTVIEEIPSLQPSPLQTEYPYAKDTKVPAIKLKYVDSTVQTSVKTTSTFTQTTKEAQAPQPSIPLPPALPPPPSSLTICTTAFQTIEPYSVQAKAKEYASTSVQTTSAKYSSTSVQTISRASKEAGVQTEATKDVTKELLASQAERLSNEVKYYKDEAAELRVQVAAFGASVSTLQSEKSQLQAHLHILQTTNESLSSTSATNAELTKQLLTLRTECQGASARYDAMKASAESNAAENASLKQQLQAAQAAVAGSPSAEAVQTEMEKMQAEFNRQLEMKGRDVERVRAAGAERLSACQAQCAQVEKEAKGANALRQEVAVLKLRLGQTPGGKVPGDGSGKNAKKLEEERDEARKMWGEFKRCYEVNKETLRRCEEERMRAVTALGELEREFAKYRASEGQGVKTVFVAPSVAARPGRKRGAEVDEEDEVRGRSREGSPRKRQREKKEEGGEEDAKWDFPQ